MSTKAQEKYENMEASERQKRSYVSWADIITTRDNIKDKTSNEYLLLCMYTMIPPARADMNVIKIYYNNDQIDSKKYPNHLLINKNTINIATMHNNT